MRPPSAAQSRAGAVAPAPRGFPVVACPDSIARDTRCLLLTHTSITKHRTHRDLKFVRGLRPLAALNPRALSGQTTAERLGAQLRIRAEITWESGNWQRVADCRAVGIFSLAASARN